jgi:ATP-binding cassette subfamily B protein
VLIDGVDMASMSAEEVAAWQRSVALVSQNSMRLPMSFRANVTVTRDGTPLTTGPVPDRQLLDFAADLPDGWETTLDTGQGEGTGLSGGQWQRVALARALLRKQEGAGVMVLDEPVAAVDVETEANLVARYLEYSHGMVTIIVSHRFSIVRDAAQILVLEGGRLVEHGSHAELLARRGTYSDMFRAQASRFDGGSQ